MLTDFQNFFTDRFSSKYATKSSFTIPPHLKGVAELPCETSVSENSACIVINNKSQGSAATCLRCGELFSNHFTMDLLLSLLVKQFLKSVNIWRSYRQEVTNRPLIIFKSILLQYLFFCVAADAYSHTVGIVV